MKVPVVFTEHDFDWFVHRLGLEGARLIGERDVLCRCPAHEDYSPSLHVREDEQGLLVHCFAGCSRAEIEEALEDAAPTKPKLAAIPRWDRGTVVATYDYRNAEGELIYRKLRLEPKSFEFRRPVIVPARTEGPVQHSEYVSWRPGLKDTQGRYVVEPVPYNLPELRMAMALGNAVWIVDGEKDADALNEFWQTEHRSHGLTSWDRTVPVATCSPTGMRTWSPEWSAPLRDSGVRVVIVADNDEPGIRAARRIEEQFHKRGTRVRQAWIVRSPVGKDAFDALAAGLSPHAFEEVSA